MKEQTLGKISKVGNSYAITIPSMYVSEGILEKGKRYRVTIEEIEKNSEEKENPLSRT